MNQERIYQVLLSPHVSEKTSFDAEMSGRHTFKVAIDADKREVKAAVEQLFSVSVVSVQMIKVKGKTKRFGQMMGRRSDWKKAIVRLSQGQEIDLNNVGGAE